jgi:hypothetical protein
MCSDLPLFPFMGAAMDKIDAAAYDLATGDTVSNRPMFGGGPATPVLPFPQRVYAGQIDPADSSHFTIEYVWPDGVHGFLDGYLRADRVDLAVRPGTGDVQSALASFQSNPKAWIDK